MNPRMCTLALLAAFLPAATGTGAIEVPPQSPIRTLVPEIKSVAGTAKGASKLKEAFKSFQKGQIDECFDLLEAATKAQANLPPARLMLGRLFLAKGQTAEGRRNLERAVIENPDYPAVYLTFGKLAFAEGRVADAFVHFEKASSLEVPANWTSAQGRYLRIQLPFGKSRWCLNRGFVPSVAVQCESASIADDDSTRWTAPFA